MKIGIIGSGNVGIGILDALVLLGIGKEIVLYARNVDKANGEVWDLNDTVSLLNGYTNVVATSKLEDLDSCEVIVITVGAKQEVGEDRLHLLKKNSLIIKDLILKLDIINIEANIIVVTNPVDILTRIALQTTSRSSSKLFGSGTVLDTIRLREEIGVRLSINRKNIHAFVVGEHGDSEFILWSVLNIGANRIDDFNIDNLDKFKSDIAEKVKKRAYRIIEKKGYTKQAIGVAVAKIIQSIIYDEKSIFTLSTYLRDSCSNINSDVTLSQPCVVGKSGIEKILMIDCDSKEADLLKSSIQKLEKAYSDNVYED